MNKHLSTSHKVKSLITINMLGITKVITPASSHNLRHGRKQKNFLLIRGLNISHIAMKRIISESKTTSQTSSAVFLMILTISLLVCTHQILTVKSLSNQLKRSNTPLIPKESMINSHMRMNMLLGSKLTAIERSQLVQAILIKSTINMFLILKRSNQ